MDKLSAPQFAASLNGLAEVFDRKAITPKALEVWFDTLKEFETNRVLGLLATWPKGHSKFPAPAEVWVALTQDASGRRERVTLAEKKAFEVGAREMGATAYGGAKLAEILRVLKSPKPSALQHWTAVQNDPAAPAIAKRFAENFFHRRGESPRVEREPGQDDEEVAA